MDTKTPVAGSSKSVENTTENNTKNNINIMTEDELNIKLSRGVKPKEETKETLTQLVRWRIQEYKQHNWRRYLSEIFAEEFVQFVKEDFNTLDKQILDSLRDCLRANEVYVPKGRGIAASQALADVVQEDIPWPEDDEERPPPKHPQQHLYQQAQAPAQQAQAPAAAPAPAAAQGYPQQQAQQQQPVQQPIVDDTIPTPGETCIVELPSGPTDFRVTAVKPYLQESDTSTDTSIESPIDPTNKPQIEQDTPLEIEQDISLEINETRRNPSRHRQLPTRFQNMADITIYMSKPPPPSFQTSRLKEINGLLGKGVFEIMNKQDVPAGARIFDSRLVDQIKNKGTEKAFEGSRLTYTQSRSELARDIVIQASVEMRLSMKTALRTYHKLYGIAIWFHTYHKRSEIAISDTYTYSRIQLTQ